jgi:autotransporter-associated beta strand protein
MILEDDLHIINNAGASTATNGGVQLANPVTGIGNITFISDGPISSTDTTTFGSISLHNPNTFTGSSLIQKGLVVVVTGDTPFGDAANGVKIGDSTTAFDAALLSRNSASPINYAITVDSGVGSRMFGSAAEADYTVSTGNVTLNGGLNLRAGTVSTTAVQEYSGVFSGVGSLTKTGTAVAKLSGANTYTGNTDIQAGTLSITSPYLANAANVLLTTGAILDLSFEGTDSINALFIDAVAQASGIWGAAGSGATHESSLLTGTGFLLVSPATLAGDYNSDGKVDAADYVVWRKNPGAFGGDPAGYNTWRANFGNPPASGSILGGNAAVPEPGTAFLAVVAGLGLVVSARMKRARR